MSIYFMDISTVPSVVELFGAHQVLNLEMANAMNTHSINVVAD